MMVAQKEARNIRRFVCDQLRDEPDLSTLTIGILKRRYLALVRCQSLSPEAKIFMKQVVKEELTKMQDNDTSGSELKTKTPEKKRKREKEIDEVISGEADESMAKKSHFKSSSLSESEDEEEHKTGGEESESEEQSESGSEDEAQEEIKSKGLKNGNHKRQIFSEDSADDEINESEKEADESDCGGSPDEIVKNKADTAKNGETGSSNRNQGKKTSQSDEENGTDSDNGSGKTGNSSDDSETEQKVSEEKKNTDLDSDSSSLPSLDDEQDKRKENGQENKRNTVKKEKKEKSARGPKDENKSVVRLKRYIALCGVRRNYKKLLDGCRSVRSQVAALKKELEDLGVNGQPTIEKCKKVRMKREEAQELAELDVSNIITTQGRPKRRQQWQERQKHHSSAFVRTLNSGSDSDQENSKPPGQKRATDWANLRGIISDDADSD